MPAPSTGKLSTAARGWRPCHSSSTASATLTNMNCHLIKRDSRRQSSHGCLLLLGVGPDPRYHTHGRHNYCGYDNTPHHNNSHDQRSLGGCCSHRCRRCRLGHTGSVAAACASNGKLLPRLRLFLRRLLIVLLIVLLIILLIGF